MLSRLGGFLRGKMGHPGDGGSYAVQGPLLEKFISRPDFPRLVSFPRTGSHWLRMVMELYFEKPSLVRIFYYRDAEDFTCYHRHDEDLSMQGVKDVIYLYRNPVDTIYSQMNYYKEDVVDEDRIRYWSDLYGRHLSKWLLTEDFTEKKTVITYEGLMSSMPEEFAKVCEHFGHGLDTARLDAVLASVSKGEVKKRTSHDNQVVDLTRAYQDGKRAFRSRSGAQVIETVLSRDPRLEVFIGGMLR